MHDLVKTACAACLCAATAAFAQAPAPGASPASQPSAGGTPDKMPFDIPYGAPIGLDSAKKLIALAEAEAKRRNWEMNIAVVDPHGDMLAFERMDGAQYASIAIAQNKARTAARFRRETRVFYNLYAAGQTYVGTYGQDLVASPGGFPLIADGKVVGAIGCSGGTGDQDATVCGAAVNGFK